MILLLGLGRTRDYTSLRLRELFAHLVETLKNLRTPSLCLSLPYEEGYSVECGKLTGIFLEEIAGCLEVWQQTPYEDWIKALRLFFAEGESHVSEILLGVQAVQSVVQERLNIRVLIPSEQEKG